MTEKFRDLASVRAEFDLATGEEVSRRVHREMANLRLLADHLPRSLPYIVPVDRAPGSRGEHEWMAMGFQPGLQPPGASIWYVDVSVPLRGLWIADATTAVCALPDGHCPHGDVYRIAVKPAGL